MRFARLRVEKRHNYVRKVAEEAARLFIANDKVFIDVYRCFWCEWTQL
jgi:peptide subunit release factor 1 (eRF1)